MRINQNAFVRRNILYAGFIALSVSAVQVNAQPLDQYYPAGRNAFDAMSRMAAGSTTQYGMHLTGPGVTGGMPVTPQNLSGWTKAGNYGVPSGATGPTVSIGGKFTGTFGTQSVPLTAVANTTKVGLLAGIGKLLPIIGNGIAIYQLLDGIKDAVDASGWEKNIAGANEVDAVNPFRKQVPSGVWKGSFGGCQAGGPVEAAKCSIALANGVEQGTLLNCHSISQAPTSVGVACTYSGNGATLTGGANFIPTGGSTYVYGNWDTVRGDFEGANFDAQKLLQPQLDALDRAKRNGIDGGSWNIPVTIPTITGPSSLPQTKKTETRSWSETGPDGITRQKTETKETTTNSPIVYDKDKVKVVPTDTTVTTTTTQNPDGSTTTETGTETKTEETSKPQEEKSDFCVEHPDVLACATPELDTPEGEIPKVTKDITYQEESIWGSGSCPADKIMTTHNGQTLKVWDFAKTCEMINWAVGPIVLVIGAYTAFIILALGKSDL